MLTCLSFAYQEQKQILLHVITAGLLDSTAYKPITFTFSEFCHTYVLQQHIEKCTTGHSLTIKFRNFLKCNW